MTEQTEGEKVQKLLFSLGLRDNVDATSPSHLLPSRLLTWMTERISPLWTTGIFRGMLMIPTRSTVGTRERKMARIRSASPLPALMSCKADRTGLDPLQHINSHPAAATTWYGNKEGCWLGLTSLCFILVLCRAPFHPHYLSPYTQTDSN